MGKPQSTSSEFGRKVAEIVHYAIQWKGRRLLPFWGKFTAEIDSTNLNCLTKFGYLKELLVDSVRTDIDGLPFNEDGYANAKVILEPEYGQTTEIVNAYVKNIMGRV